MNNNKLFAYNYDSVLKFHDSNNASITKIKTLTFYNLVYTMMLNLRRRFTSVLAENHSNNITLLKNIGTMIIDMQFHNNLQKMNFDELYKNPSPIHTQMMLAQMGGKMYYHSELGESFISMANHTDDEQAVLIDFLINVLSTTEDITKWHDIYLDWVTEWPTICDEWEPSFLLGTCINYPSVFIQHGVVNASVEPTVPEVPLL